MRIALFTDAFADRPLADVLGWLVQELPDIRDVELGTGGYSPAPHLDLDELLSNGGARRELLATLDSHDLRLAALNVSGNPLEQNEHDRALRGTIALAALLGVDTIVCMSGGRAELAGAGWYPGLEDDMDRYWSERVIPYWQDVLQEAGAVRLCLELEPGCAVFNLSTFERLAGVGENLAVNLDPSHFFWQDIDPLVVVERLGRRIGYAHGKDTVREESVAVDGLLDRAAWRYATVGHGHDLEWWRSFVDALEAAGYDGPISIEYEDPLVDAQASVVESARVLAAAAGVAA